MRRFIPALLLVTLALLAPHAAAQATTMPLPAPEAGDLWRLDTTLAADQTMEATATIEATGAEQVEVGGETHDAYRVETRHEGQREGETVVTWYRVSDLAKLRVAFQSPEGETVYSLSEPCREWRFPLAVGDSWTTDCAFTSEGDSFTIPSTWTVERAEPIVVPAGSFDAVVLVQQGDGFTERWWFAPDACWWVRHESLDADGNVQSSEEVREVVGCAPPATVTGTPPSTPPTQTSPVGGSPTPDGATPTPPTGEATPTGGAATPPGGNGATTPAGEDGAQDTPGAGALLVLAVVGIAALVAGRTKRS